MRENQTRKIGGREEGRYKEKGGRKEERKGK